MPGLEPLGERYVVVDLSTFEEIKDATHVDEIAQQARVVRAKADGNSETVDLHFPAGLKVVRRR